MPCFSRTLASVVLRVKNKAELLAALGRHPEDFGSVVELEGGRLVVSLIGRAHRAGADARLVLVPEPDGSYRAEASVATRSQNRADATLAGVANEMNRAYAEHVAHKVWERRGWRVEYDRETRKGRLVKRAMAR